MLIRPPNDIASSEITPESTYLNRRQFFAAGAAALSATAAPVRAEGKLHPLDYRKSGKPHEKLTSYEDVISYNNFYEFGVTKEDPKKYAGSLTTSPWSVVIDGLVEKPVKLSLEDILKPVALEERIYRLRCVEGWSMVIPWVGFPLSALLKRVAPLGSAKYVAFETLVRPSEMRAQNGLLQPLKWPYLEGLRLDEAMHPLTIMAVGLYGKTLPNQSGAPLRLVVPWKYGFKSIKSIVRIHLSEKQPMTTWNKEDPVEYGFYSNVNPKVSHPRWSQATERRIGDGAGLFVKRRPTLMFNGYGDQVAHLYQGMDLKKFF